MNTPANTSKPVPQPEVELRAPENENTLATLAMPLGETVLTLTASGQAILEAARSGTQSRLAEVLAVLSPAECRVVIQALQALRPIFTPGEDGEGEASR